MFFQIKLFLSACLLFMLSACGTIFTGWTQSVSFDSNVAGTSIYINGIKKCQTPCQIPLARQNNDQVIIARAPGYKEQQLTILRGVNIVSLLNLFSIPSWTTDVASGAVWEYHPNAFYVDMVPLYPKDPKTVTYPHFQTPTFSLQSKQESKIRHYVLFNHAALTAESFQNGGEYTAGLTELSHLSTSVITQIFQKQTTPVEALDAVMIAYNKKQAKMAIASLRIQESQNDTFYFTKTVPL